MTTTVEDRSIRAKILDVSERRHLAIPLEMRTDGASGNIVLEGYAATYEAYDVYGGVPAGGWVEQIDTRAFDKTLSANPDVQLLVNHEGWPLARTKSGTLSLTVDNRGLKVRANLDPTDPDVQRLLPKMRRKDMDEMSFAFRVTAQDWSSDYTERTITEINLQKGDVSVVNYGMNPTTSAMISTEAVGALAKLSNKDLVELRKMDRTQVRRAIATLRSVEAATPKTPAKKTKADATVHHYDIARAADGGAVLVAVMTDGTQKLANASQVPASMLPAFSTPTPANRAIGSGSSFGGGGMVWQPQPVTSDPHNFPGYTKDVDDPELMSSSGIDPGAAVGTVPAGPQIATATGYDPHNQTFGPKQMLAMEDSMDSDDRADTCPGGDMCPGASCPDHGEMDSMDEMDMGEECGDDMDSMDDPDMRIDLGLAAALESTIVSCMALVGNDGDDALRALLTKARSQIRDLRGHAAEGEDVTGKLSELRAAYGDPETMTVSQGLRALQECGFADTIKLDIDTKLAGVKP